MRIAVLSDVHANLQALQAVIDHADGLGPDEIWCLGDVVGYGADPAACLEFIRERCALVLAGNHDLWSAESPDVRQGAIWRPLRLAADTCDPAHLAWLHRRSVIDERHGVGVMHGSPANPVMGFISTMQDASRALDRAPCSLNLYGHTHVARGWERRAGARRVHAHRIMPSSTLDLSHAQVALLNPGAVGRPQADRHAYAMWMMLDLDQRRASWHRVDYDVGAAQRRMQQMGIAASLTASLAGRTRR